MVPQIFPPTNAENFEYIFYTFTTLDIKSFMVNH